MPTARKMLRRALAEGRLRCTCGGLYWNTEAACRCAMTHAREDAERYLTAQHQDAAALGMWLQRGQLRPSCGCSDGGWVCAGSGFGGSSHVLPCHHVEETWLHTLRCLESSASSPVSMVAHLRGSSEMNCGLWGRTCVRISNLRRSSRISSPFNCGLLRGPHGSSLCQLLQLRL